MELKALISENGFSLSISDDDCDLIDSIYLPTKYPMGSSLPYFYPDNVLCVKTISLCESVLNEVMILIEKYT